MEKILKEINRLLRRLERHLESDRPVEEPVEHPQIPQTPAEPQKPVEVVEHPQNQEEPKKTIQWCYGGFNGSKAVEDARCRISSLKAGNSSMSMKWETKVPSDWKTNDTDKGRLVVIAIFYEKGGVWYGGKFDWTDSSRTTRSFENIHKGYHGWNPEEFKSAKRVMACVVSADGKKRSNWVEATK